MPPPKRPKARKLLIASIGVAAVTYVGCSSPISGNLIGQPCPEAGCGVGGAGGASPDAGCADGSADAGCK